MNSNDIILLAKNVFNKEIEALQKTNKSIDDDFVKLVDVLLNCQGKIIVTGIGKPGHIGAKIAATLASLGTPAFFMHPSEAMHGDLGMVESKDIVMLLSYSGESSEIVNLLPVFSKIGSKTIAITGNSSSILANKCDYQYILPPFEEACYLHLAPTSSSTALLVLGDALAVVISRLRNYTKDDFGLHHPAGVLGKKLLVKVKDLMYSKTTNAIVYDNASLQEGIVEMSSKGLSIVTIIDKESRLKGIITDGDLRRLLEKGVNIYETKIKDVMTINPKWIEDYDMAVNALQRMNDLHITGMPVLNKNKNVVGAILLQDIIRAGILS